MKDMTTALIAGASGLIGGHLLDMLLKGDRYERVRAVVRRPLGVSHPRLEQVQVDWTRLGDAGDRLKADDVFCALGTTMKQAGSKEAFRRVDHDYPLALAEATRRLGAESFSLVTAIGSDPGASIFYYRVKGEVEEAVKGVGFARTHIFRPAMLLGERSENRPGERVGSFLLRVATPVMVGPLRKVRPVEARDVAACMYGAAADAGTGVRVFENDEIRRAAGKR